MGVAVPLSVNKSHAGAPTRAQVASCEDRYRLAPTPHVRAHAQGAVLSGLAPFSATTTTYAGTCLTHAHLAEGPSAVAMHCVHTKALHRGGVRARDLPRQASTRRTMERMAAGGWVPAAGSGGRQVGMDESGLGELRKHGIGGRARAGRGWPELGTLKCRSEDSLQGKTGRG